MEKRNINHYKFIHYISWLLLSSKQQAPTFPQMHPLIVQLFCFTECYNHFVAEVTSPVREAMLFQRCGNLTETFEPERGRNTRFSCTSGFYKGSKSLTLTCCRAKTQLRRSQQSRRRTVLIQGIACSSPPL